MMKARRTQRLLRVIQLLQAGRDCETNALRRVLGVSRRTLFRDLGMLKAAGVPVVHDRKARRFAIAQDYFLPPVNLTVAEAKALMLITRRMIHRQIHPNHDAAVRAATKIEAAIPAPVRRLCETQLEYIDINLGPMSEVDGVRDLMERIGRAILDRRKLCLSCATFGSKGPNQLYLRPYRLAFLLRTWQVVGYSESDRGIRAVSLHHIEACRVLTDRFQPDRTFRMHDYLASAWAVTQIGESHHVIIRFSSLVAEQVESVTWHTTQRTSWEANGSLIFEVDVDGLEGITEWILGYGEQAIVLQPLGLREIIRRRVQSMACLYGPETACEPRVGTAIGP